MAILDRVKNRIETDLPDDEIQMLIDEANQDIVTRFGPHANPADPLSELLEGWKRRIVTRRPVDISEPVVITEYYDWEGFGETQYTLSASDFRFWAPSTFERRSDGLSSTPRSLFGDRVRVTYVPVNDGDQREEVIIKLVMLAIEFDAVSTRSIAATSGVSINNYDYQDQRDKLLASLSPRQGLDMA